MNQSKHINIQCDSHQNLLAKITHFKISHLLAVQSNAGVFNHNICDNDLIIPLSTNWNVQQITDIQA